VSAEQPYGGAYAAILREMVRELDRSKRAEGRAQKRASNTRIGAWRQALLCILLFEHGMNEEQAERAVLDSVRNWKSVHDSELAAAIRSTLRENGGEVTFSQLYRELGDRFLATEIKAALDSMSGVDCSHVRTAYRGPGTLVIRSNEGEGQ
jgi:hypothetical protein